MVPAVISSNTIGSVAHPLPFKAVIWGGLLAGGLDGLDAVIFFGLTAGVTPAGIFQYIASGLLGAKSFQGGCYTVALGIALHFMIALGAATVFSVASLWLPALIRQPVLWGPAFGLAIYFFMYHLVIPLSLVPSRVHAISVVEFVNEILADTLLVGLPIAMVASRSKKNESLD